MSRDFKTRYKRSYLGILWSLFNPLLLILVYTLAFDYIMKIRVKNFPMFFMCGFLPWSYFSAGIMISLSSFRTAVISSKRSISRGDPAPFDRPLLSSALSHHFHLCLSHPAGSTDIFPNGLISLFRVIILLQTVFIFGLSLFLSSIHVYFRDLRYILDVILMAWFWLTPIVYPTTLIPESYLFLYTS